MDVRPPPPERDVWIEKERFKLADLEEEMEKLRARLAQIEPAEEHERTTRERAEAEFRALVGEARRRLEVLRTASDAAWHELRGGVDAAIDDVRSALHRAREQFERH